MEANFSAEEAARTRSAAKPLTFLPERRMLFIGLAVNSRKEILYDATRILGESWAPEHNWGCQPVESVESIMDAARLRARFYFHCIWNLLTMETFFDYSKTNKC